MTLEIRLIAAALVILACVFGYFTLIHKGEVKCEKADTAAAERQLADMRKQRDDYAQQLKASDSARKAAEDQLARLAGDPIPHVLCYAANPQSVRQVPTATPGELATPGTPDSMHERGFDPGPTIRALSVAYERRVEGARDALNKWPVNERGH